MEIDTTMIGKLISDLSNPAAYPEFFSSPVELHETHISLVFLAGSYAYKIKKPLKTDFLDYTTLEQRRLCCAEELRLDCRYAPELYLDVVPIVLSDGRYCVGEVGVEPVEVAVRMRRFPGDALLSTRLAAGVVTTADIQQLAYSVAAFHEGARVCEPTSALTWPGYVFSNSREIFARLVDYAHNRRSDQTGASMLESLKWLSEWSEAFIGRHKEVFDLRAKSGWIRECHGDLHCENVVYWNAHWVPFDGIEFNERLRWIDVLSDSAFLSMDLTARGHPELASIFMKVYLEQTGQHACWEPFRWFHFYRALVRALVASMRDDLLNVSSHLDLAALYGRLNKKPEA